MTLLRIDRPRATESGRPNRFTVDLGAIAHNVSAVRAAVGTEARLIAAVKADAYGFGLRSVAPVLRDAGVDGLALVDVPDAVALREDGIRLPILLYGGNLFDEGLVRLIEEYDLTATITDMDTALTLSQFATRQLAVYAEVDVGLERLGFPVGSAGGSIRRVANLPHLELQGIYTHMHLPRGSDSLAYADWQFRRFEALLDQLRNDGLGAIVAIAASSDVLALTSSMNLDGVDVGKLLYGTIRPIPGLGLRNAFHSLTTRLTHVAAIDRHEYVDRAPFRLRSRMRVGIVPMGIAHGLRGLGCQSALVRGCHATVVGEPSMEHCRLDITDIDGASVGDEVVLVGVQGSGAIRVEDLPVSDRGLATFRAALEVRESVEHVYLPATPVIVASAGRGESE